MSAPIANQALPAADRLAGAGDGRRDRRLARRAAAPVRSRSTTASREHDIGPVNLVALVYLGFVLVRPLLERVIVLCTARAGERFLGDLRVAAYDKLQQLSMPFFEETRAGVLVSRLTADVQTLTTFTRLVLVEVVGSVLLFVVSLVILVTLSPLLSLRRCSCRSRSCSSPRRRTGSGRSPRSSRSVTASPTR